MNHNAALKSILETIDDPAVVAEVYDSSAVPTSSGFDPNDALIFNGAPACFSLVEGVSFRGVDYVRLIAKIGGVKRTISAESSSATIDFNNFERAMSDFEFEHGFEGLIIVIRLISRSRSVELTDSLVLFAGACDKPKSGNKQKLSVTAQFILGALEVEIPRRKFSPDDQDGRTRDNPAFEGFPFTPQSGVTSYSIRKKQGGILGWFGLKKTERKTINWSSFSGVDVNRDVPEIFGRVQMEFFMLGYADVGTQIRMRIAGPEGQIEDFINVRSTVPNLPLNATSYHEAYGELGNVGNQNDDPSWPAPGLYSRTSNIRCQADHSLVDETDPAPDIVGVVLGRILLTPNPATGVWDVERWTDNPAAIPYFLITSPYYWNLDANWLHAESFREAFDFNDEILFDESYSDFLFVPDSASFANLADANLTDGGKNNYLLPTSTFTPQYIKFLKGEISAKEAFSRPAIGSAYSSLSLVPIDPPDPDDPDDEPPTGATGDLTFFLRRRYTFNAGVMEKMKCNDFMHKVVNPVARQFFSMADTGQIKLNNKKPADWALGSAEFTAGDDALAVDDVSPWIGGDENLWGHLLIEPHTNLSEIRDVVAAAYDTAQNSVALAASANITVTGFAGCDGDSPATATLRVDAVTNGVDPTSFTLDGVEVSFNPSSTNDTVETVAGFIYASINAHPVLKRRFRAIWSASSDEVAIIAKFGTLDLDSGLGFAHDAPIADPTVAPTLTATAGGSLEAGAYRVAYAFENSHGQTLLSPYTEVTLAASEKITVTAVTLPTGADSIVWYVVPTKNSRKLRFHSRNDGSGFVIDSLPLLTAPLTPDLNRTGTEVLRVAAVFSDRPETRSNIGRSNVLEGSFEWLPGRAQNPVNRVILKYKDATQDFRPVELRLRDDANYAKTKKWSDLEINGAGIDNHHQAYRIANGELAEKCDADFFYKWAASYAALLLEEGDVVAITDGGSGVCNLPVRIEEFSYDFAKAMPKANFSARKYSTTLYDDSVAEREVPVVIENA